MAEDLQYEGYILVRDNTGKVFERQAGNKFWWTVGSLRGMSTEDIELPVTVLIKE